MRETPEPSRPPELETSGEDVPYSPFADLPKRPRPRASRPSRAVAWLMDEMVSIPGTKIRFGLDAVIGVFSALGIPVGDVVANLVSSVSLVDAVRRGMPFRSTMRILGNILINSGVGSIPVLGDLFSVFFRSNSRNRDLIEQYLATAEFAGKEPSWWRVAGSLAALLVTLLLAVAACVVMYVYVGSRLWEFLHTPVDTIFQ